MLFAVVLLLKPVAAHVALERTLPLVHCPHMLGLVVCEAIEGGKGAQRKVSQLRLHFFRDERREGRRGETYPSAQKWPGRTCSRTGAPRPERARHRRQAPHRSRRRVGQRQATRRPAMR
jgi:hypothetical protein